MSIIIRLQNLPWEANSLDIRRFFTGLQIPDGGVHIVGGEKGDAFIAFASDEDARQAMERAGGQIKESRVKLMLSSRNEMQQVIEQARTQTLGIKATNDTNIAATVNAVSTLQQKQQLPTGANVVNASAVSLGSLSEMDARHSERGRNSDRNYKTRDRSRSPHYASSRQQQQQQPYNAHGNRMNDVRNARLDSRSMHNNNNSNSNNSNINDTLPPTNHYNNGNANNNDIRNRLGGYVDSIQQMPSFDNGNGPSATNSNANLSDRRFFSNGMNEKLTDERFSNQAVLHQQSQQTQPAAIADHIGFQAASPMRTFAVEMRGLPYQVIPRDIQDFFREVGLFVPEENIKILVNANGYTTGGAKVRFISDRDFDLALSLNGRFMNERRIDVMPFVENDLQTIPAVVQQSSSIQVPQAARAPQSMNTNMRAPMQETQINRRDYVVYMKGIPYNSCTQKDVTVFYGQLQIQDIVFETDQSGKPAGNAYVEFSTREDYNLALEMNLKHMGRRYIEIFPTTKEDMNEARRQSFQRGNTAVATGQASNADVRLTYCINITGLPPTVTNRDLTNYFLEVGAQPYAIHIMLKPNGYNAGEAFLEFLEIEHQQRAIRRDGENIGNYRIAIKAVAFDFMRSIVNPIQSPPPPPPPPQNVGFQSSNANSNNMVLGQNTGASLPSESYQRAGPMSENRMRGGRRGPSRFDDRRNSDRNRNDRRDMPSRDLTRDPFSDPRSVILATNIPYRATNEDICVFFADFHITPECVLRRYNEKGQPTADARIAFRSPDEANRALRMMHKKFLIERPVFLRHAI